MLFQRSDHIHPFCPDLTFQPGCGLFANAVMVAHGCAGCLDGVQNAILQREIIIDIRDSG